MTSPILSIVAAVDEKRGIGKNNRIPWHIKKDLIHLRDLTKGRLIILGRRSYESMAGYYDKSGREMPAKEYIVISSDKNFKSKRNNTFTAISIKAALDRVKNSRESEVFVIGGASVFEEFLKYADRLYLTIVKAVFDCDTFFPDYSKFKKEISFIKDNDGGYDVEFRVLEK